MIKVPAAEEKSEFLSAAPDKDIFLCEHPFQAIRKMPDNAVAYCVVIRVIDQFKFVYIGHYDPNRFLGLVQFLHFLIHEGAVMDTCEKVGICHLLKFIALIFMLCTL
ncbi:Uncharacterised protein [Mycobacteroides abscessus subsp. abscessus]|nr:Uncharacterised protein [Mycobacteroides abscessus subsp. abscessus]